MNVCNPSYGHLNNRSTTAGIGGRDVKASCQLFHRHSLLKLTKPIEDDLHLRLRCDRSSTCSLIGRQFPEQSAVRHDVILPGRACRLIDAIYWNGRGLTKGECGLGLNANGDKP